MEQPLSALQRALHPGSAQAPLALNVDRISLYRPPLPPRDYRKTHNWSRAMATIHVGRPRSSPIPLPNRADYDNGATVQVARTSYTNIATAAS